MQAKAKCVERQLKHNAWERFFTGWETPENSFGENVTRKLSLSERFDELRYFCIRSIYKKNYINKWGDEVDSYIVTCPAGHWRLELRLHYPQQLDITIPRIISINYHVFEDEGELKA